MSTWYDLLTAEAAPFRDSLLHSHWLVEIEKCGTLKGDGTAPWMHRSISDTEVGPFYLYTSTRVYFPIFIRDPASPGYAFGALRVGVRSVPVRQEAWRRRRVDEIRVPSTKPSTKPST